VIRFHRREERWLELAVLIDASASMALWEGSAAELLHVLTRLGAFRNVLAWSFDADEMAPRFRPYLRRGVAGPGGTSSAEGLAAPGERRAFLIISDGVGEAWRQGTMTHALGRLARRSHVSIVNPLPHRMWHRTGIQTVSMYHRVTGAKDTLRVRHSRTPWSLPERLRWLPVWHLDTDELGAWARLLAGTGDRDEPGQSMAVRPPKTYPPELPGVAETAIPAEQVARFRASVSSDAFALATQLAAVPLSLPVMRMIQETVAPGAGTDQLAEILLSGLLVRASPRVPGEDPDQIVYDFARGIREQFLSALTRTEVLISLNCVARAPDSMARLFGGTLNVRLLTEPDGGSHSLPEQARHFAGVAVTVLESLGPAYGDLAVRIAARLEHDVASAFRLIRDGRFSALTRPLTIVQVDGPARQAGDGAALGDLLADRIEADPQARPDLLVACEDVVSAATTEEVARSAAFFGRLLTRFQLAPDRLMLAPAPVGWQDWGAYEYARAAAGRNVTFLLERALGCPDHGADSWWRTDLADHEVSLTVLDSTQMPVSGRFGALGTRQLAWLSSQGDPADRGGRLEVVIMHHDPASRLLDASAFYSAAADPGLLLHGWGFSASATALASSFAGAPAVPDPAAGYVMYGIAGRQVAVRGRQAVPMPVNGRALTSSIVLATRQATAASLPAEDLRGQGPALLLAPYARPDAETWNVGR
jgi:hypothetical protein